MAHMVKMKGDNLGGRAQDPVQTITAGGGHHGVVTTRIAKAEPGANLHNWPKIRDALNEFCGYNLGPDEIILFRIDGDWYFMADIGLRMLTPRELYRANGFPDDYIIDRDYLGNEYKKAKQVARCGNAVPPPFATALVWANWTEMWSTFLSGSSGIPSGWPMRCTGRPTPDRSTGRLKRTSMRRGTALPAQCISTPG